MINRKLKQVVCTFTLWTSTCPVTHTADLLTIVAPTGPTPILSLHYTTCMRCRRWQSTCQASIALSHIHQGSELEISFSQKEGVCDMNALLNSTYWQKKTPNHLLITGKEISASSDYPHAYMGNF